MTKKKLKLPEPKVCKNCYGKGYRTSFEGYGGVDESTHKFYGKEPHVTIKICNCERGDMIKKHFSIKAKYK